MSAGAASRRSRRRFEVLATVLIGMVALLAAILGALQADFGMASARASAQASRMAADAEARLQASGAGADAILRAKQDALVIGMNGMGLSMAALTAGDQAGIALGEAQNDASSRLTAAVEETAATSGHSPVDPYTASLITATSASINALVTAQNEAVDVALDTGARSNRAVLGLSLATLGGVLAGIAVVLKATRAGWVTLGVAWGITVVAAVIAVLVVL